MTIVSDVRLTKSKRVTVKTSERAYFKRVRTEWKKIVESEFLPELVDTIQRGESPVLGVGDFKEYSDAYAKKKDMPIVPVDMTVTGRMLRSLKIREIKNGIRIWFADRKASYHDQGKEGRRLLPRGGEKFTMSLATLLKNTLEKALDRAKK